MYIKKEDAIDFLEFYKLPKIMIKDTKFRDISFGAKILYCLLLDRLNLSIKNNWSDENGIYQYFTIKELMLDLSCSEKTVIKFKKELTEYGLIKEKRQFNGPNKIYLIKTSQSEYKKHTENNTVRNCNSYTEQSVDITERNCNAYSSETVRNSVSELESLQTNKTDINKTYINNNDINNNSSSNNIYIDLKNKTTDATADNSLKNLFDYYQERIGLIDSFQYQMILEYVKEDGMAIEIIEKAIGKAADNGKRNFNYVNSILKNWKQNGITTLAQVESEERSFSRKVKNNKHGSDHSGIYDPSDVDLLF